jgi:chaperonin cofactor prefoldin
MEPVSKQEFNQAMTRIDKRFQSIDQHFEAIDKRFDTLEARLAATTVRLEHKMEEEFQGLATMVARGFEDLAKRLYIKDRVDTLEKKMTKVESALNVRL